jgi:hypothetical protein
VKVGAEVRQPSGSRIFGVVLLVAVVLIVLGGAYLVGPLAWPR